MIAADSADGQIHGVSSPGSDLPQPPSPTARIEAAVSFVAAQTSPIANPHGSVEIQLREVP